VIRLGVYSLRGSPAVLGEVIRQQLTSWIRPLRTDSDVILMDEDELATMEETIEVLSDEDLMAMVHAGVDSDELCDGEEFLAAIGADPPQLPSQPLEPIRATWHDDSQREVRQLYDELVKVNELVLRPPVPLDPLTISQEIAALVEKLDPSVAPGLVVRDQPWWRRLRSIYSRGATPFDPPLYEVSPGRRRTTQPEVDERARRHRQLAQERLTKARAQVWEAQREAARSIAQAGAAVVEVSQVLPQRSEAAGRRLRSVHTAQDTEQSEVPRTRTGSPWVDVDDDE
jgi:hypothetical protein